MARKKSIVEAAAPADQVLFVPDDAQDAQARNQALADLLRTAWALLAIVRIERVDSDPADPQNAPGGWRVVYRSS